ncbi:SUKH-4 family immunity protein [Nocardia sp. NBC_00508]|uniref:SUKH-4 family immunity protein n=1 Tax=Nocardia sp. NBC_00508 TaxID=2975992 RepID=UPI002E805331|nr:SUKH-4 family immunity protein [Nocardia sp. NBC_00508]WUD66038.1 SUKH-4 family immunity protein [Nocardia sp. NBC_00508]
MTHDSDIDAALASLDGRRGSMVPFAGTWCLAPYPRTQFADGRACTVLADDDGLQTLVIADDGEVLIVTDDGTTLVNTTIQRFAACARAYTEARKQARHIDEDDEETLEAHGEQTLATFRGIDPAAVAGENQFWSVAAEELGYGLTI